MGITGDRFVGSIKSRGIGSGGNAIRTLTVALAVTVARESPRANSFEGRERRRRGDAPARCDYASACPPCRRRFQHIPTLLT